jgi:ppGpp synthetase/RelA/SpoT-type nucleotidyltranferase
MSTKLTPTLHKQQIEAYKAEYPDYVVYAEALKRVLKAACATSLPEAFVQARAKTIPSFAEKCARKFDKYPDAVNQFTDLCGARLIVQTIEQVEAAKAFIRANFTIVEEEDKASLLSTDKFGYRDMHFIIQLKAGQPFDLTPKELKAVGRRKAELQVRTWVQHAWADTLHDRIYKTPLRLSTEIKRAGNLLAAVMEEGDRGFDHLANELDGMLANYSAYASREDVQEEVAVLELLLLNCGPEERPKVALKLARLNAPEGKWGDVIVWLRPHAGVGGPLGLEVRSELGHALCRQNRADSQSTPYKEGQDFLHQVVHESEKMDLSAVPNLRRARSVHARAYARLGWSYEPIEAEAHEARRCYARAVELEPDNPYYLADMLGFELHYARESGLLASFRSTIRTALDACVQHEDSGTELPTAHFTAGRLRLLLDKPYESLHAYARGIRYCLATEGCVPCDVFQTEIAWLHRVNPGRVLPEEYQWVKTLLEIGTAQGDCRSTGAEESPTSLEGRVLLVVGGAVSMKSEQLPQVTAFLKEALEDFSGTVVSGGTTVGVPGCLGVVAEQLTASNSKHFHLQGYIPRYLPEDAEKDRRYDEIIVCTGDKFSPAQVLRGWQDCLAAGVKPADVLVLGFGGGKIAAFEYRLALALGATVGVVCGTGGAADELLKDSLWSAVPGLRLYPLPSDAKTIRAFVVLDGSKFDPDVLDVMAKEFHVRYVASNVKKIRPEALKPWDYLPETYKKANRGQAAFAIRILKAAGFDVRPAEGTPVVFADFKPEEIELMAQLEHGRWNIERLREGWRPGKVRDDEKRIHNCLVAWSDDKVLTEEIKNYDRDAVRAFPEILAKAGLEVFRPAKT